LDHICDPLNFVAFGIAQWLHDGWDGSYPVGRRYRRDPDPSFSESKTIVALATFSERVRVLEEITESFFILNPALSFFDNVFFNKCFMIFLARRSERKHMSTILKTKTLEQLLAEADELVKKINSEHLEDLEEEHRLQFEKHAQRLQELKSKVQAKPEGKGIIESFTTAEGMHEAILDIVKAMKDLTKYLT